MAIYGYRWKNTPAQLVVTKTSTTMTLTSFKKRNTQNKNAIFDNYFKLNADGTYQVKASYVGESDIGSIYKPTTKQIVMIKNQLRHIKKSALKSKQPAPAIVQITNQGPRETQGIVNVSLNYDHRKPISPIFEPLKLLVHEKTVYSKISHSYVSKKVYTVYQGKFVASPKITIDAVVLPQ